MPDETKAVELNEEDLDKVAGGSNTRAFIVKCSCGWCGSSGLTKKGAEDEAYNHKVDTGCTGTITYVGYC